MIKVLNLYAGIGGNRKLWEDVEVTAVENNPQIAKIYQDFFPKDKVVVGDAHKYLLDHFKEFDFIWSSPPCATHSRIRQCGVYRRQYDAKYPDMKLYEEILFLKYYHKKQSKWVVENVASYYEPLVKPHEIGRHYIWCNFHITQIEISSGKIDKSISDMEERKGVSLDGIKINQRKDQILRNCVEPELGLHILNESKKNIQPELFK